MYFSKQRMYVVNSKYELNPTGVSRFESMQIF